MSQRFRNVAFLLLIGAWLFGRTPEVAAENCFQNPNPQDECSFSSWCGTSEAQQMNWCGAELDTCPDYCENVYGTEMEEVVGQEEGDGFDCYGSPDGTCESVCRCIPLEAEG